MSASIWPTAAPCPTCGGPQEVRSVPGGRWEDACPRCGHTALRPAPPARSAPTSLDQRAINAAIWRRWFLLPLPAIALHVLEIVGVDIGAGYLVLADLLGLAGVGGFAVQWWASRQAAR